ncbi:hypothetical protein [Dactylosporangium sp. CA-092794]|uniref:hypothetical protein n=1 Tax=Dactylosporangium sp. CA-092794 TaxID=3239929 RepID=UPI003D8FA354
MSAADRVEEIRFRQWLRTVETLPADVPGDDRWNFRTAAAAWDAVTAPLPAVDTADDADGW